jgi:molybdenum cofactor synthesis domain-containing protein
METASNSDPEINLLEKTELWIKGMTLQNAQLDEIAEMVADVLGIERREVLVVDVREDHIVLDILQPVLKLSRIAGKGDELLKRISDIPGVTLSDQACIHSEGALGWVALDAAESQKVIENSVRMGKEVRARVAKRAIVFSTGFEVEGGMIADTNYPLIAQRLRDEGYTVKYGGILPDEPGAIAYQLLKSLDDGFGLIITTGGVGAEAKDCSVEALLRVDPAASTPYIIKFKIGTGRHVKDGVRIAVGEVGISRLVALPGPTREVKLGIDRLLEALVQKWEKDITAEHIASALREIWRGHGHHRAHSSIGEAQ